MKYCSQVPCIFRGKLYENVQIMLKYELSSTLARERESGSDLRVACLRVGWVYHTTPHSMVAGNGIVIFSTCMESRLGSIGRVRRQDRRCSQAGKVGEGRVDLLAIVGSLLFYANIGILWSSLISYFMQNYYTHNKTLQNF